LDNYEEFDYVINNNGSFEELDKNVIKMLKSVTNKVLIWYQNFLLVLDF